MRRERDSVTSSRSAKQTSPRDPASLASLSPAFESLYLNASSSSLIGELVEPCGESEIRTRGTLRLGGLVNRCTRPLCDLSLNRHIVPERYCFLLLSGNRSMA
jgi:hypothetical protein